MALATVKSYICPSAAMPPNAAGFAVYIAEEVQIENNSTESSILQFYYPGNYTAAYPNLQFGITNYQGNGGSRGDGWNGTGYDTYYTQYAGLFGNRSQVSLGNIPDGTSQTLMIGEVIGDSADGVAGGVAYNSWMGCGVALAKYGLGGPIGTQLLTPPAPGSAHGVGNTTIACGFASNHDGVVQFVFGDGSVHGLVRTGTQLGTAGGTSFTPPYTAGLTPSTRGCLTFPNTAPVGVGPNWFLFQQLAGYRDQQPVPPGSLGF